MKFKITNGLIYDPKQNKNGIKSDIYISDGKIVTPHSSEIKDFKITYDVSGMIVMAGGIDIHSHIAGGNVNNARVLLPEIHQNFLEKNLNRRKNLPGFNSRWSAEGTGYRYAEMGFTTVVEPAVLPINSFTSHLELEKIPMIDKACLSVLGNDSFLLSSLNKKKGQDFIDDYVAFTINSTKSIGLKVINAGGGESFKQGKRDNYSLDDVVPEYGVSSRQILNSLCNSIENLKVKHPLHVHCNNLGMPGNIETILDTIDSAEGRRMHLAHVQFYGYSKEGKKGFSSGATSLCEAVNKNKNITVDVGQVMFKPTVTISSDILRQFSARKNAKPRKWIISEVEDGGGGIVPYSYNKDNFINASQWLIGLEIFLLIKDPSKVFFTTDHPNGAPFTSYPELFRLLMDYDYRMDCASQINQKSFEMSHLKDLKREYTLNDIAIMTRSAPADILGLNDRGSLAAGHIADISIYNPNFKIDKMFRKPVFVFKNGFEIVKNGIVQNYMKTQTQALNIAYDDNITKYVNKWISNKYTLDINDLSVDRNYFSKDNFKFH